MGHRNMYGPLRDHLARRPEPEVVLSFKEIEDILGCALPPSARGASIQQWWANTHTHSQAKSWLEVGRRARVVARDKRVVFTRESSGPAGGGAVASNASAIMAALSPAARRFVEDSCEELGVTADKAIAAIIDTAALEHRRRLVDWFAANSPSTTSDSAALIREDRDGR